MPELQLRMVRPNLDHLPEINIPEEYEHRTYFPVDDTHWTHIMNTGIGDGWTPERCKNELTMLDSFMQDCMWELGVSRSIDSALQDAGLPTQSDPCSYSRWTCVTIRIAEPTGLQGYSHSGR